MSTTDLPELNTALMDEVMGRIWADPYSWNQRLWACGTQRCYAGHTVEVAGARIIFSDNWSLAYECELPDGRTKMIAEYAQELLGLTDDEAEYLFNSTIEHHDSEMPKTPDELQERVKNIIDGRS